VIKLAYLRLVYVCLVGHLFPSTPYNLWDCVPWGQWPSLSARPCSSSCDSHFSGPLNWNNMLNLQNVMEI
jgi:hypothetical protein